MEARRVGEADFDWRLAFDGEQDLTHAAAAAATGGDPPTRFLPTITLDIDLRGRPRLADVGRSSQPRKIAVTGLPHESGRWTSDKERKRPEHRGSDVREENRRTKRPNSN